MTIKKFDSINVVPFIDIMLVLLVIVLTTASFVAKGVIPVDLPDSKSASKSDDKKTITITINKTGKMFFEKTPITIESLAPLLEQHDKKSPITINCDKEAKFELFVTLIDTLKAKEFNNIGIIANKEK